jgi:hypothetical protein
VSLEVFAKEISDILSNVVARISNNFHTEGEYQAINQQVLGLVDLAVQDVETDVAGLVTPGAPVAVTDPNQPFSHA